MGKLRKWLRDFALGVLRHPGFAYATILLLQLKVIWGLWRFRDLTSGDTSSYFITAYDWYRNGHLLITWSPLYTSFYGAILYLSTDAYVATIAHRLITVLVLSVLVLAFMRKLLPPAIAWLMAAWWVVLPIDFDAMYEVHIFTVIPIVLVLLAILYKPGPIGRGWAVAILIVTTFLMRNEFLLTTLLFATTAICWDARRKVVNWRPVYAVPAAAACLLIFFYYVRSNDRPISGMLQRKHTLNICQTYAFGYQQRTSDWKGSPWTECQQLMTRVYGVPEPTLSQALFKNPQAMLGHFWWNLKLLPDGLEVLLFNCMFGSITPDYIPQPIHPAWAALAGLITLSITTVGLVMLWRDRRYWWEFWLSDRVWAWIAMGCVIVVAGAVIITQRPRPSYLLSLGLILRAIVGMCLFAIVRRIPQFVRAAPAAPAGFLLVIVLTPPYYFRHANAPRPLLDGYRRLEPFEQRLRNPGSGLVATGWAPDLCNYLTKSRACQPLDFRDMRRELTDQAGWDKVLDKHRATLFYADATVMADAQGREFVADAASYGWRVLGFEDESGASWSVLGRSSPDSISTRAVLQIPDIAGPDSGVTLGQGWYDLETFPGGYFRWVDNDAQLTLRPHKPGPISILLDIEAGPSLKGALLSMQVLSDGQNLRTITARGRQTLRFEVPESRVALRLHVDSVNAPVPHDQRILNFRVFRIATF